MPPLTGFMVLLMAFAALVAGLAVVSGIVWLMGRLF